MMDLVRSGDWLTFARLRAYSAIMLAMTVLACLALLATSDGLNDYAGRPLGTDFSNVYAAGTYALEGRAAAAFDPALQHAREQAIFGAATPFYGWHYPPFFLLLAAALATMPFLLALAVWQMATLPLFLATIGLILPRSLPLTTWLLPALAFPAVFANLMHGHNGFLSAALLGSALLCLRARRPLLAGVLFGLMAYKPQFGLLVPVVLLAEGRWRTIAAATATVLGLAAIATLSFGVEIWAAFLAATRFTTGVVLAEGLTGWPKLQSVFAWTRMWSAEAPLAYALQAVTSVAVAGLLWRLWCSAAAFELKAAALLVGTLLATPYAFDYDMMILGPALAFLAAHGLKEGFAPWDKSALALGWIAPFVARPVAMTTGLPLGLWAMALLFAVILTRAKAAQAAERQANHHATPAIS